MDKRMPSAGYLYYQRQYPTNVHPGKIGLNQFGNHGKSQGDPDGCPQPFDTKKDR